MDDPGQIQQQKSQQQQQQQLVIVVGVFKYSSSSSQLVVVVVVLELNAHAELQIYEPRQYVVRYFLESKRADFIKGCWCAGFICICVEHCGVSPHVVQVCRHRRCQAGLQYSLLAQALYC